MADLIDLAIEFATLGEYGLEHPAPAGRVPACPGTRRTRRHSPNRSRLSPRRNPTHPDEPCRTPGRRTAGSA
ncbi:MAG: hypothetical protein M9938_10500 [Solirubrobacterales bacterium]|nr:hypothetical protein [Solirubrobacterales bacterium]